ncbi:hypothetical protein K0M31_018592 [Melipona bicolor]|uniref:Uncharacterized protein n=1 Tax=Melipona bicolor TaxID=60889 RepID=A0AA40G3W2_9HYME|nr:hypothetical protein K0M31_018592 [Melipona bicolor]
MGTEEYNSKTRPSRPSWGNEISRPSESLELINKKIFHVSTSNSEDPQTVSSNLSDSAKHLSPIEEYLQMTMRLIASKSLSPRTSVILKDLYVKYKLNWGYNSNIDINGEDWIKVIEHYDAYKETFAHLEKKKGSKGNSSTSKKEQLETESRTLVKTKIPMEDTESPWFTLQTVQDSSFERPCSEIIQINDVFSDFSLADAGHDKTMKELVKQWMTKEEQFLVIAPGQSKKDPDPGEEKERVHNKNRWKEFIVLAALLAVANAGGPAAYDIATASGDLSSIGFSQESTQKGLGGQNVISSYTKSDDSAHSFVRVSSHSISNDALLNYDISHTYAAPYSYASAAPVIAKTAIAPAPLLAKTYAAPVAAAPLLTKSYATPVAAAPLLTKTYAAPLLAKTYAAPLLAKTYATPVAAAPLLAKTYTAPVAAAPLLAKTYAAPVAAAPLLAKTYAAPAYAATPLLAKTYAAAAPLSYAASAAPLSYAASAAPLSYAASAAPLSYAAPAAPLFAKSYGYTSYVPTIDKIAPAHGFAAASIAPAPLHSYAASKTYGYEHIPYSHTSFSGFGSSYSW